ncbi:MAG: AsmA family protein [Terriglobales bacterium]
MKFLRSRRGLAVIAALLLILFLFRPGIHQLRNRIANSIGSALGRRVAIDNVHLQLLPRPGFDLEGLVIYDDPAFGAEPMIRAPDVFAAIRFRSLLRGRLEIAKMSATEPSINVVRNSQGRWNLAGLIERNAQIPAAPTQKAASERRPAFPYLEATGARINFKIGQEKKSYALTDADVALWQDSENSWGARMKAQPVRTDFNLTDTGRVQIDAHWQRSRNLRLTPMRLTLAWENGQLGQITKLVSGRDRGFRGAVTLTANFAGTPHSLAIDSRMEIDGFRRYDIVDRRNVNMATSCTGNYSATSKSLTDIACESPAGDGAFRLQGSVGTREGRKSLKTARPASVERGSDYPAYDLTLVAEKVPLASAFALFHQAKQQLPPDLTASGTIDGEFHAEREGAEADFNGSGTASDVRLVANAGNDTITLGDVPLTLVGSSASARSLTRMRPRTNAIGDGNGKDSGPSDAHLRIGPAELEVNSSLPGSAGGWVSATGYRFFLRGDLEFKNLFRLEYALGLPAVRPAAEGEARLDVSISGAWKGLAAPNALGTAQLRNVRAETHGLNTPIEISSATVVLGPETFSMQMLSAQTGSTHWSGLVAAPRHCTPACTFQFDLTADRLSAGDLAEWFTPHPAKRPWYRILNSGDPEGPSPLLAIRAHGNLHVGRLELRKMPVTQIATQLAVDHGKFTMTDLHAAMLQGTHQGNWTVDASLHPPRYTGNGTLENISLAQLSGLMNDAWVSGNAEGSFDLDASGVSFRELLGNADGNLRFVMRNGSLAHVEIPGTHGPLSVYRFAGDLRATKGVWELSDGRLESRDGLYRVIGTAGSDKGLNFILTRGDEQSWNLTGTLAKPRVMPVKQEISSSAEADAKAEVKP